MHGRIRQRVGRRPGRRCCNAPSLLQKVANTVVEHFAPAYVIVNGSGEALYFSAGTGKYLQAAAGPPTAMSSRWRARVCAPIYVRRCTWPSNRAGRSCASGSRPDRMAALQTISLAVEPISEGSEIAYGVVFIDRGPTRMQDESANAAALAGEDATSSRSRRQLQETEERLQATIEELETANEEFRSSNEELVSVNEELQSTNEELETSKEELQSVNEELQTVNNELNSKIEELDRANSDLTNLFRSTQIATIFLDRNLVIRSFTPAVTKLFNLIAGDRADR